MHLASAVASAGIGLLAWLVWLLAGSPSGPLGFPVTGVILVLQAMAYALAHLALRRVVADEQRVHWLRGQRLVDYGVLRADRTLLPLAAALLLLAGISVFLVDTLPPPTLGVALAAAAACAFDAPLVRREWPPVPQHFEVLRRLEPVEPPPEPVPDDLARRDYGWRFAEEPMGAETDEALTLYLSENTYAAARQRERFDDRHGADAYPHFVFEGLTEEVRQCAAILGRQAAGRRLCHLQTANYVLAFCCDDTNFPYRLDEETHGRPHYANFPIETLYERESDCEDHAILAVALYRELEYDAIFLRIQTPVSAHLAVGVAVPYDIPGHYVDCDGKRYFYAEATPEGRWTLGECPREYLAPDVRVRPIPMKRMSGVGNG